MDWFLLVLNILLVVCGAYFVGYPIGKCVGRRQIRNIGEPTVIKRSRRRLESSDVLNAEYLEEEVKRWA